MKKSFIILLTVVLLFCAVTVIGTIDNSAIGLFSFKVNAADSSISTNVLPVTFNGVTIVDCNKETNSFLDRVIVTVKNGNDFAIGNNTKIHYKTYDSNSILIDDDYISINSLNPSEGSYEKITVTEDTYRIVFYNIEIEKTETRNDPAVEKINNIYTNALPYESNGLTILNVIKDEESIIPDIKIYMENNTGHPIKDTKYWYDSYIHYREYDSKGILLEDGRLSLLDVNDGEKFCVSYYPNSDTNKVIFSEATIEIGEKHKEPEVEEYDGYLMNKNPSIINGVKFVPFGKDTSSYMYNTVKYAITNNSNKALSADTKVYYRVYDSDDYCIKTDYTKPHALNNGESAYIRITGGRYAYKIVVTDVEIVEDLTVDHVHQLETLAARDATCTQPGLTEGTRCTICNQEIIFQSTIPPLDHNWGAWTDNGFDHIRTCLREGCGKTESTDHNWDDGLVITEATCTDVGEATYTCTVCKATKTETIDPTGKHNDSNKDGICDVCSFVMIKITTQPKSITQAVGTTAKFTVAATGSGTLSYQWKVSTDGKNWTNSRMTGYNTPTLQVPVKADKNGYKFLCVVTGEDSSVKSSVATLTVIKSTAKITTQPKSVTQTTGTTASFTVAATGSGTLSYQWKVSTDGTHWTNSKMTGYNTATLQVPVKADKNGYKFLCVVTDANGSVKSSTATLTVIKSTAKITAQPKSLTQTTGTTASFTVAATGSGTLSYQWKVSTDGTHWTNSRMTGYNTPTLQVPVKADKNGYKFCCVVTDANGSVTSSTATLTVA